MISVSQATQSLNAAGSTASVQLSRTALIAAALPTPPSVIVTLGNALQEQVLYNASGLLPPSLADETSVPAPDVNTLVEPASNKSPPPAKIATAEPASTVSPTIPVVAENTGTTTNTVIPLTVSAFVDPGVRALADFTTNPAHGNLATALNVNAAIYRAKQFSSASLVSAIDLPGPVTSLNAINVDITDLGQQSAENQRRRGTGVGA